MVSNTVADMRLLGHRIEKNFKIFFDIPVENSLKLVPGELNY